MIAATLAPLPVELTSASAFPGRTLVWRAGLRPRTDNGERDIERVLQALGITAFYEAWQYQLSPCSGFRPDFWLPATDVRPELHLEVTWLDRHYPGYKPHAPQVERFQKKLGKIQETRRLYGLETILVPHAKWCEIMRHPEHLQKLIDRATRRSLAA